MALVRDSTPDHSGFSICSGATGGRLYFTKGVLSLQSHHHKQAGWTMANLVVRNLDKCIVDALKQRAARHGRSTEAEHRALLEELLLRPKRKSFAEALRGMPGVGQDEDFERVEDVTGNEHVFG